MPPPAISVSSSPAKKICGRGPSSMPKKSASEMGRPSSTFFSEPTEGLVRFCSIREMMALETPGALGEGALGEPVHQAKRPQPGADIDVLAHGELFISLRIFNVCWSRMHDNPGQTMVSA